MILKKHHTIKYIYNRVKYKVFEMRNPDTPWMTQDAIELLNQLIMPNDIGIEYGSGRSTFWFANKCKYLTSFENNKKWYAIVNKKIAKLNNVRYKLLDLNETPANSTYVKSITGFDNESIDFIIVDGKYREYIALAALKKLKKGGILIFDNAERYLPNEFDVPESIGYKVDKVHELMLKFIKKTITWRKIWTTNGVSTTLILFKL